MNTLEVLDRLRRMFAPPEYGHVVEFERIDFVAVGCWRKSRYDVTGVEVKVSRSDWRRELAHEGKGEHGRRLCDFWFVAAPAGIVRAGELPDGWGLIEFHDQLNRMPVKPRRLRPRWDGVVHEPGVRPLTPTAEYLARWQFAMLARRWAYSDADRRALSTIVDPGDATPALDRAALATGRLTAVERATNAEYAREQREHTRAWRAHLDHEKLDGPPVDGCDYCEVLARRAARQATR